ncbi:MAG: hypothetical protein J5705_00705 [Bacteroidaceae bacterium]|nr:hypothetical protein [Bacteroidaceae bacterium]
MFNAYRFFVPNISDLFRLILMFWTGWFISVALVLIIQAAGVQIMDYQIPIMTVACTICYGSPMLYALIRSRHNSRNADALQIEVDKAEFHMSNTFASVLVCVVSCLISAVFAVWITSLLSTEETMGRISSLLNATNISIGTQIVADLIFAPVFFSWFICAMTVRGLIYHGIKPALTFLLAYIAIFIVNLDYTNLVFLLAAVGCVALVYNVTRSMKLSYICTLLMYLVRSINRLYLIIN